MRRCRMSQHWRPPSKLYKLQWTPYQSQTKHHCFGSQQTWSRSGTHRATDLRIKQRIMRTLIEEIVVDIDQTANEVVMLVHWSGGRHTELRVSKPKTGEHNHRTALEHSEPAGLCHGVWEHLEETSGVFPAQQAQPAEL